MTESESVSEVIFLTTFMWGPDLRRKEGRRKLQVSVFCHPKPLTAAYCSRIPSGAQQSAAGSPTLQSRQRPCGGGGGGTRGGPCGVGGALASADASSLPECLSFSSSRPSCSPAPSSEAFVPSQGRIPCLALPPQPFAATTLLTRNFNSLASHLARLGAVNSLESIFPVLSLLPESTV